MATYARSPSGEANIGRDLFLFDGRVMVPGPGSARTVWPLL